MKRKRAKKKINFSVKKRVAIFGISLAAVLTAFLIIMSLGSIFSPNEDEIMDEILADVDKETGKINILAIGLDKGGLRTDTIIIVSYDMDNEKVNLLSIPRDTRVYTGGHYQKINSAYAIAKKSKKNGVAGTIEAVTHLTAIPINYYVEFTFETFREAVDALGGVDFDVPQNMDYDDPAQDLHIHLKKGPQHMDGDKAEQLVRFRKYPMGDIDRVKMQQAFLKALAEQKLNSSIIGSIPDLFKVLQKDVKTNFNFADVAKYAGNMKGLSSDNINAYSLPGAPDSSSYGASYWIADMKQVKTLVEETFGYDASEITIRSEGEKSSSKDTKKTEEKKSENKKEASEKSKESPDKKTGSKNDNKSKSENKEETDKKKSDETKKDTGSKESSEAKKSDEAKETAETKNVPEEKETAEEKEAVETKESAANEEKSGTSEEPLKTDDNVPREETGSQKEIKRPGANPTVEE